MSDVPGETPTSPVLIVVSCPLNEADVPAITANSEHSPSGINGAFVVSAMLDLKLLASAEAKAAKMVAMIAKKAVRDLDMVVSENVLLRLN